MNELIQLMVGGVFLGTLTVSCIVGGMLAYTLLCERNEYLNSYRRWLAELRAQNAEVVKGIHLGCKPEDLTKVRASLEAVQARQPDPPGWMFWVSRKDVTL